MRFLPTRWNWLACFVVLLSGLVQGNLWAQTPPSGDGDQDISGDGSGDESSPDGLDDSDHAAEADEDGHDHDPERSVEDEDDSLALDDEESEEEELHPAQECPGMFGSQSVWDDNEAKRKKNLVRAYGANGRYTVMHKARSWGQPVRFRIRGLDLEDVEIDEDGHRSVLLEVSEDVADLFGCEAGLYELERDNSLLRDTSVLKILDDAVLLDYQGHLVYLPVHDWDDPSFRLVWQSRWAIPRPREEYKPKSRSRRNNRRKKRRNKRRRNRRKRR